MKARIAELEDIINGRTFTVDEGREWKARAEAAEAKLAWTVDALGKIRELNMTGTDEDGHRWAHSDLIEQEIVCALQEVGQ